MMRFMQEHLNEEEHAVYRRGGMQEVYHRRKTSRSRTIEEQPALKL